MGKNLKKYPVALFCSFYYYCYSVCKINCIFLQCQCRPHLRPAVILLGVVATKLLTIVIISGFAMVYKIKRFVVAFYAKLPTVVTNWSSRTFDWQAALRADRWFVSPSARYVLIASDVTSHLLVSHHAPPHDTHIHEWTRLAQVTGDGARDNVSRNFRQLTRVRKVNRGKRSELSRDAFTCNYSNIIIVIFITAKFVIPQTNKH